jgi:hypothetical protein
MNMCSNSHWLPGKSCLNLQFGREVTVHPENTHLRLTFMSFFMWSALLTVAHQALTIVSVSTSLRNVQWKRQPLHVSKRVVFLPLRGLPLTIPRANVRFSQSNSVALRSGALLYQRFPNFFQVGTTFISENVLRTTFISQNVLRTAILLSPLKANC